MRKGFLTLPTELLWLAYSLTKVGSRGNSVGGLPRNCGSIPSRGKVASRMALGHTQSPFRWVPGIMRPGSESDNSPPSSFGLRMRGAIFPLLLMRGLRTQEMCCVQLFLSFVATNKSWCWTSPCLVETLFLKLCNEKHMATLTIVMEWEFSHLPYFFRLHAPLFKLEIVNFKTFENSWNFANF